MSKNKSNSRETITYNYAFKTEKGTNLKFQLKLDADTLNLIQPENRTYPQWTKLEYCKCPGCPLSQDQTEVCPVAASLLDVVEAFDHSASFEEVDVVIDTEERKYTKHASLQSALSSLVGIYMVTNSCPVMQKLRPMVRYHLPFATMRETQYRVVSMYLLAQFFLRRRGKKPDWELKNLMKIYDDIRIINQNICKRLNSIETADAIPNALVRLNCLADFVIFSVDEDILDEMELMFNAYLK